MMESSRHIYKEDAEGSTMCVSESMYQGKVLHHPPEFTEIPKMLESIDKDNSPREGDVWLISYPKSGSNWMYELISILLNDTPESDMAAASNMKINGMIEASKDIANIEALPSPRVLNTHVRPQYLSMDKLNKSKLICIVRNPKSVAVSYYHHTFSASHYEYNGSFKGYLPVYLEGYHNLFGNWFENTQEWWEALKDKENAYFVFYEELKQNPIKVIEGIANFLCVERDAEFYQHIAERTSFSKMSNQVIKGKDGQEVKRFVVKGYNMLRKGTIDDWKNYFTVAKNEEFDQLYEEKMKNYSTLRSKITFE